MTLNQMGFKSVRTGLLGMGAVMAVAAMTLGAIAPAQAQVIDFEDAAPAGSFYPIASTDPYIEQGFSFANLNGPSGIFDSSAVSYQQNSIYGDLLGFPGGSTITVARADGGVFDLNSLLIGALRPDGTPTDFTIVGYTASSSTSQSFTGVTAWQTATLNYTNLTSATITSTGDGGIDRVTLNGAVVTAAAPEPGSIALALTAGVPVVGIIRRRKKK